VAGYIKMVYSETVTHPSINRARKWNLLRVYLQTLELSCLWLSFHSRKMCLLVDVVSVNPPTMDFASNKIFHIIL